MFKNFPFYALFIACSFVAIVGQTPTPWPDKPVVTEEIIINVSAFDRTGAAAQTLTTDDLVIMEDGRIRRPVSVARKTPSILIAMDTGGLIRQKKNINTTRQIAERLVNGLRQDARIGLMQFHDRPEMVTDEWTNDKAELVRLINSRTKFGRRATFTAGVDMAIDAMEKAPTENRHLILITDGQDSVIDREANRTMMQRLWRGNFTVHVVSYTQIEFETLKPQARIWREGDPFPKRMPDEVMQALIDSLPTTPFAHPQDLLAQVYPPRLLSLITDTSFIGSRRSQLRALTRGHLQLSAMTEYTGGTIVLPETIEEMAEKAEQIVSSINSQFVVTFEPARPLNEVTSDEIRLIKVNSRNTGLKIYGNRRLVVFADQQ